MPICRARIGLKHFQKAIEKVWDVRWMFGGCSVDVQVSDCELCSSNASLHPPPPLPPRPPPPLISPQRYSAPHLLGRRSSCHHSSCARRAANAPLRLPCVACISNVYHNISRVLLSTSTSVLPTTKSKLLQSSTTKEKH